MKEGREEGDALDEFVCGQERTKDVDVVKEAERHYMRGWDDVSRARVIDVEDEKQLTSYPVCCRRDDFAEQDFSDERLKDEKSEFDCRLNEREKIDFRVIFLTLEAEANGAT
jgi:hypothetical protein